MKKEGRADGSGRAHEKENPRAFYAVRPTDPTRAPSPRQLPTDHDPAVPTRVYQSDQSSLSAHRCHLPCLPKQNKTGWIFLCRGRSSPKEQPIQNPSKPGFYPWLDKSLHIRTPNHLRHRGNPLASPILLPNEVYAIVTISSSISVRIRVNPVAH
jgi:hypothetical protein